LIDKLDSEKKKRKPSSIPYSASGTQVGKPKQAGKEKLLYSSPSLPCKCKIPVSQVTVSDNLSHTEPTAWLPLPTPFVLLLRETGFAYDHCIYAYVSVC